MTAAGATPAAPRVLAIASGGGHWEQMMLLRPAFEGLDLHYATPLPELALRSGLAGAIAVPDFNARQPFRALAGVFTIGRLVRRLRPSVIVSTGAAPGLVALGVGRLIGANTIWIDSVANSERLSLSGRMARRIARLCLTQWEHLAAPGGPEYAGSVL